MAKSEGDDLDAVRAVVAALEGFQAQEQERILRWAREKLGLSAQRSATGRDEAGENVQRMPPSGHGGLDIKSFVEQKSPQSDNQFAATVAYFYKFEAPESEKKNAIGSADLQDACRKVGRDRLGDPNKTLANAHGQGYLDKGTDRGTYTLNTVGENLIAMTLPSGGGTIRAVPKNIRRAKKKKSR